MGMSNVAPKGEVPMTVKIAYYIAAAVLLIASIWTVLSVKEYEPKTYNYYHGFQMIIEMRN